MSGAAPIGIAGPTGAAGAGNSWDEYAVTSRKCGRPRETPRPLLDAPALGEERV